MRMGATHFLMKRLPKLATEMALHALAYNLTRVMNLMGSGRLSRRWAYRPEDQAIPADWFQRKRPRYGDPC